VPIPKKWGSLLEKWAALLKSGDIFRGVTTNHLIGSLLSTATSSLIDSDIPIRSRLLSTASLRQMLIVCVRAVSGAIRKRRPIRA
jgi:hypothetical protein